MPRDADEDPGSGFSPESLAGSTTRMLLIVDDPDAAVRRAVAAGATEITAVHEAHRWRMGQIQEPFGHHWEIGVPLIPWPPGASTGPRKPKPKPGAKEHTPNRPKGVRPLTSAYGTP